MARLKRKVRILSALEAANYCGVVNQTTINWIKNGHLKAFTTPGGQYRIYAEDLISFMQDRNMQIPDTLTELARDRDKDRKNILVVDDDRPLNNLILSYLNTKLPDYTVYQAFDGFTAGSLLTKHKPVIVILDIDLPGMDGHQICRNIKADPDLKNPFILSITGTENPDERERMMEEGADALFSKPFEMDELFDQIAELEEKRLGIPLATR